MEGLPKRHLLLSVDESPASERAADWAVENLFRQGDELHLFHVIPPGQYIVLSTDLGMEDIVEDDEETQRKVEEHARVFLTQKFATKLEAKGIPYQIEIVKFATDSDSVEAIICKRAEQLNVSAVVMARHSKGAIKEFFVGSATNYCTHHCKAPVVVLHCD